MANHDQGVRILDARPVYDSCSLILTPLLALLNWLRVFYPRKNKGLIVVSFSSLS